MIKRVEKNNNKIIIGKKQMLFFNDLLFINNTGWKYEILLCHVANFHVYLKHNLKFISNFKNTIYFYIFVCIIVKFIKLSYYYKLIINNITLFSLISGINLLVKYHEDNVQYTLCIWSLKFSLKYSHFNKKKKRDREREKHIKRKKL